MAPFKGFLLSQCPISRGNSLAQKSDLSASPIYYLMLYNLGLNEQMTGFSYNLYENFARSVWNNAIFEKFIQSN